MSAKKGTRRGGLHVLPPQQQPAGRTSLSRPRPRRQRLSPQLTSQERMIVYEHLLVLNRSFHVIVQRLDALVRTHLFSARDLREMQGLTQEVQTEINTVLLDPFHSVELDDWAYFGKTRTALEQRLRGDEPPPPPKKT